MMIDLIFHRLEPEATLPTRANETDSGYDLYAIGTTVLQPGETHVIPTGICMATRWNSYYRSDLVEDLAGLFNVEAQVRSRSGLAAKRSIFVLNSPGTVDEDYRGEVKVILRNEGDKDFYVLTGDRIAQLVPNLVPKSFFPVEYNQSQWEQLVEEETANTRGTDGFGSTGV